MVVEASSICRTLRVFKTCALLFKLFGSLLKLLFMSTRDNFLAQCHTESALKRDKNNYDYLPALRLEVCALTHTYNTISLFHTHVSFMDPGFKKKPVPSLEKWHEHTKYIKTVYRHLSIRVCCNQRICLFFRPAYRKVSLCCTF
jgi:hypothetical protein